MLVALIAFSVCANAATLTYERSIPIGGGTQQTDWVVIVDGSHSQRVPFFNPAWGTLNSVSIALQGDVSGNFGYENTSSVSVAPTVDMILSANVSMQIDSSPAYLETNPYYQYIKHNVPKFDGTLDYAGTSGEGFYGLSSTANDFYSSPPPVSDLAYFTGIGYLTIPVWAIATSRIEGPGNVRSFFDTFAGAQFTIQYEYEPNDIPEWGSLSLASLGGFIGLPLWRRRRK